MKTFNGAYLVAGALNVTEMKVKLRRYSGIPDNNQGDLIPLVCGEKHFWEIRLRGLPAAMNSIRIVSLVWAQDGEKCFPGKMNTTSFNQGDREKNFFFLRANEGVQISITKQVG
jgi:hypothetical protein